MAPSNGDRQPDLLRRREQRGFGNRADLLVHDIGPLQLACTSQNPSHDL